MKIRYIILFLSIMLEINRDMQLFSQNLIVNENFDNNELNSQLWKNILNVPQGKNEYIKSENVEISNGTAKLKLLYQPDCYEAWEFPTCTPCSSCVSAQPPCVGSVTCPTQSPDCWCLVPKHFDYTRGSIVSQNKYQYGTFEIRCKISGSTYDSFWLYGECCEEIDVFEFSSCDDDEFKVTVHKCEPGYCNDQNAQGGGTGQEFNTIGSAVNSPNFANDFHVFTLLWTPDEIAVLVDYEIKRKCKKNNCLPGNLFPSNPMHVVIDISQNECAPPPVPAIMEIDYIRIWEGTPPDCDGDGLIVIGNGPIPPPSQTRQSDEIITLGNVILESGESYNWTAGNYILLTHGFEVAAGADFNAEIKPCMQSCIFCRETNNEANNNENINITTQQVTQGKDYAEQVKDTLNNIQIFYTQDEGNIILNLSGENNFPAFAHLYNSLGQSIQHLTISSQQTQIDITSIPKGVYFVKVQIGDKIYTEKVVVQ